MRVCKPPAPFEIANTDRVVFLAGSIDQGRADHWQAAFATAIRDLEVVVLDPRRDVWDASLEQSIHNPEFCGQVTWELDGLARADQIAMWFAPGSQAPIALLELGLHAHGGKLVVGCPPEFWRHGNVEIVCARFAIPLVTSWDDFVTTVRASLARTPTMERSR